MEGLIESQRWSWGALGNFFYTTPLRRPENVPFKKDFASLRLFLQQLGSENVSIENTIFVIAFRIFEKSGGAIAPASPMAARCLLEVVFIYRLTKMFLELK